ncbi:MULTISPECIES: hypothetical protein [Acidiphilium]|nr:MULTISPECIES: hypothetical protein [Acidiphilium]HQT84102.1 hypothetical protein [Acidiphilium rubrum]
MSTNDDDEQAGFAAEAVGRLPDLARVASAPDGETVSFKKKR